MEIKKDILWRVYLCFLFMVVLSLFVIGKAFYIQQIEGEHWRKMGEEAHLKYFPMDAERGSIYSEDGNILSTSVPIFDIYIDFGADGLREKQGKRFKENIDSLSINLANLFGDKTAADYKKELQLGYNETLRYYSLKKKVSFDQYTQLQSFPLVRQGRNKSGFIIESRDKRINPYVLLANRTIGISRPDPKMNVGLELTYDSLLRGTTGQRLMRYAAGAYIPVEGAEVDPVNGKDVVTTLDTYMQDVVEGELMDMLVNNNSLHGTAILMETSTGKIKAIANLGKQPDGSYIEDLNYGIGKATEPGSVFKLVTLLSLLEDKYANINSIVDCEGGAKSFSGLVIRDSHRGAGRISLEKAFYTSSNVAFAKLANENYGNQPQKFIDHIHKFRLDQMTGVEIVASSGKPTIKTPKNRSWSKTTIPYMAHGYEELVTPLHLLTLYNAIANNGKMMKPYLVNSISEYGVPVETFSPQVLNEQLVSPETVRQAQHCLNAVVDSVGGTGRKVLFDSLYRIAGKTGTAVTALDNRGYNKGNKIYQASFMGYFPADRPQYTMAVVIQNSRESKKYYGADVSGTVFKKIADKIYGRYINSNKNDVMSNRDTTLYASNGLQSDMKSIFNFMRIGVKDESNNATWTNSVMRLNNADLNAFYAQSTQSSLMPNVVGMGLKDAIYLLENKGLIVTASGRGKVINQTIPVGTIFRKDQKVQLTLN